MKWSITIARIRGTSIRIHATFLLLLVWIGIGYYSHGGLGAALSGITFILTLFLCVALHELGHVFAGRHYGIETPDITLLPIGGVARMKGMPKKPSQEIVVALAGPVVNLVIAALLFVMLGSLADPASVSHLEDPSIGFARQIMSANIVLFLFNLIPAFPMDGGRVLRAILSTRLAARRATEISASIGQVFAFILGFVGLLYNPFLIFVAMFVHLAASQEAASARVVDAFGRLTVADVMVTEFHTLRQSSTIADAVGVLVRTGERDFAVCDRDGAFLGMLTHDALAQAVHEGRDDSQTGDLMRRDVPVLRDTDPVERAITLLREDGAGSLPVLDLQGNLVGLISLSQIAEVLTLDTAPERRYRLSSFLRR